MKIKKVVLIVSMMLLIMVPPIFASGTVLNRTEIAKNQIALKILQTNGYVTSLSFSVKIEGNVTLEKIIWSDHLKEDYFKKYTYSQKTNTLDIYLVAPQRQNLVGDDLSIAIATLVFKAEKNNEPYNVTMVDKEKNVTMVNNYYDKIEDRAQNNGNEQFFTWVEEKKEEQVDENETNHQNTNTNVNGNSNLSNSDNQLTSGDQNEQIQDVENNQNEKEKIEEEFQNEIEKTQQTNIDRYILAITCGIAGVILFIVCIIVIVNRRKNHH